MSPPPIRAVVVDDSPFVCRLLTADLQSGGDVQVVGTALCGRRAVELVRELRPDAVTLDLEMPGMNGIEALDRIMHETPTPVVVISGLSRRAADATLQALERGAVDFVLKYTPGVDVDPAALRAEILSKVRLASRIKVIRSIAPRPGVAPADPVRRRPDGVGVSLCARVVVIGASTGGPVAVQTLLAGLPRDFSASVVVVQHMPALFTQVLATQLGRHVSLPVKEAANGDVLRGGVFVAPGERHLLIRGHGVLEVTDGPKVAGHRPSIDVTMQAAAQAFGSRATGIVLTGMGNDGTNGLAAICRRGGRTYAQDSASCVVSSMPAQAVSRGVVERVGPPAELARLLCLSGSQSDATADERQAPTGRALSGR